MLVSGGVNPKASLFRTRKHNDEDLAARGSEAEG